jgi:isobutyryl-CoA mutase
MDKAKASHYNEELRSYRPHNKIKILTATALFDGHDASINIIRRLLQARGAEIVHLGHNRSAHEIVKAALEEDVQAIALSSYQGGHVEFFTYVRQLLNEKGAKQIKIFAGGGGVISPTEVSQLESSGIEKIYTPQDGQLLGLEGIIGDLIKKSDFALEELDTQNVHTSYDIARKLSLLENNRVTLTAVQKNTKDNKCPVVGVTGTGGAGKSSLLDELLLRFAQDYNDINIALVCVDPSKKATGGALLGDRIRMNTVSAENIYLRSFATRSTGGELAKICKDAIDFLKAEGKFDLIFLETSGIGQSDSAVVDLSDVSLYVMTPEYGAQSQLEKIDMLDLADIIVINKFERRQGPDALRDVEDTIRRGRFKGIKPKEEENPVFATIASRFNDDGLNGSYEFLLRKLNWKIQNKIKRSTARASKKRDSLIQNHKQNYLADISHTVKDYHKHSLEQIKIIKNTSAIDTTLDSCADIIAQEQAEKLKNKKVQLLQSLDKDLEALLSKWDSSKEKYLQEAFTYSVRGKSLEVEACFETVAEKKYPKVCLPNYSSKEEITRFLLKENLPGYFPYTAGIFPFRRQGEDPKRQFAGEGGPTKTNKRFHYLAKDDPAKRLSTAFDSITLYGDEPQERPDVFGKIGESGVSIASLDDMKKLYAGFDLCDPMTSVSMTINGPAPIILAMYLNTAIDQQIEKFKLKHKRQANEKERQEIFSSTLRVVRGTVQADILKEDQAQNTCIFSIDFALKLMGDIQEYFIENKVRNYYSVSISGYHIAEAGANPITQLAFTLANGFTYVEYYLKRGMKIDDFAPSLSFFFSNGLDAEYTVMGRVARRIWAIAMKYYYKANSRSQKLKYHIQTSGRSLHSQEMTFNDIRTTLQALLALADNCNSLHTNAYDEALTTPTETSVRQAMAIQMIVKHELGQQKCENVNQGSYFVDYLTDAVEQAVLKEFERISDRGGVLGAMETHYQRSQIQAESLHYEHLKDQGKLPIIGVNTFINPKAHSDQINNLAESELIRASHKEKQEQMQNLSAFKSNHKATKAKALEDLSTCVLKGGNVFSELMSTVKHCSLGEITHCLYEVGGRYRRSM